MKGSYQHDYALITENEFLVCDIWIVTQPLGYPNSQQLLHNYESNARSATMGSITTKSTWTFMHILYKSFCFPRGAFKICDYLKLQQVNLLQGSLNKKGTSHL